MDATFALALGGGSLLNLLARELRTAVENRLAPYDLTSQQAALLLMAGRATTSPAQVAAEIGTDTAGMTRLLDRLERKGLVRRVRNPEDRRSVVIEVTEAGRAIVPHLPPIFGGVSRQLFQGFTADELEQLIALLTRVRANLQDLRDHEKRPGKSVAS
jgi:DNA-binding MarR family transcriptional regulator